MIDNSFLTLNEDELDTLVSIAIRRAEILDDTNPSIAGEAWREVMAYEERLAALNSPASIPGEIARVGAVTAALAAGLRHDAARLAAQYSGEESLRPERLAAIKQAFLDYEKSIAKPYPAAAESGRQV